MLHVRLILSSGTDKKSYSVALRLMLGADAVAAVVLHIPNHGVTIGRRVG